MAKYVLLYSGGSGMAMTPAEQAASVQEWTAWFTSLGAAVVDWGAPFMPAVAAVAPDGSIGGAGLAATGYTVVDAASSDAAIAMAKSCPQLKAGGSITVFPAISM
jgi:hypothetical protein